MRAVGWVIVGFEFGSVWAAFFARHGVASSRREDLARLVMGFIVYTVLVFSKKTVRTRCLLHGSAKMYACERCYAHESNQHEITRMELGSARERVHDLEAVAKQ